MDVCRTIAYILLVFLTVTFISAPKIRVKHGTSSNIVCNYGEHMLFHLRGNRKSRCESKKRNIRNVCEGLHECIINCTCGSTITLQFHCLRSFWQPVFKSSQSHHGIFNMSGGAVIKHNGTSVTDVAEYTAAAWKIWKPRFFSLVNVTFTTQKRKTAFVFRKGNNRYTTFTPNNLLREAHRGSVMGAHRHDSSWCVLPNMEISYLQNRASDVLFCVLHTQSKLDMSFLNQEILGVRRNTKKPKCLQEAQNQSKEMSCNCDCEKRLVFMPEKDSPELEEITSKLSKSLTIPKTSVTNFRRTKTSVSDQRPCAVFMGCSAVCILILCMVLIILLDIGRWNRINMSKKKRRKRWNTVKLKTKVTE